MTLMSERSSEVYTFCCRRCGSSWARRYDVIRHQDSGGDVSEVYSVHGVPCPAPAENPCPQCGGFRVKFDPVRLPSAADLAAVER